MIFVGVGVEASSNQQSEKFIEEATIRDFTLEPFGELGLFSEYLEMGKWLKSLIQSVADLCLIKKSSLLC